MSSSSHHKKRRKSTTKGPELFSGFGRIATDLLTRGFNKDKRFSISSHSTDNGVAVSLTAERKGKIRTGNVAAQYKYKNATIDAKVDTESNIVAILACTETLWRSTNAIASFTLPDYKSSKLKIHYFNEIAALALSLPLNTSPAVKLSASVNTTPDITFGIETVYKTSTWSFAHCNAGITVTQPDCNLSIVLVNKGDLIRLLYVHYLNRPKKIAAVAEVSRSFSKNKSTLLVGGSCMIDQLTMVKARINNHWKLSTLLQYEIRPKSYLTLSGEFDAKALDKKPKIGLALALKL